MAFIPAYCTRCGIAFESRGIWIENSIGAAFSNNKTNCPKCGGEARFVDGVFNERGRGLEIVSGPPITYAIIHKLSDIAERAKSGQISERQAATEARNVSPFVEKAIVRFSDRNINIAMLLLAIISVMTQCVGMKMDNEFQEQLIDRLDRQIEIMTKHTQDFDGDIKRNTSIIDNISTGGTEKVSDRESVIKTTKKSGRRAVVKKQRRQELRARRQQLNPKKQ